MQIVRNIIIIFLILSFTGLASAETYYAEGTTGKDIQDVIDQAEYGDTVIVKAGTYTISEQLVINEGVTLKGEVGVDEERLTILFLEDNADFDRQVPIILMKGNSKIQDFHLDGNSENQPSNIDMGDGFYNWIGSYYQDDIEIINCWIDNSLGDLIRLRSCTNVKIHDNKITRAGHEGVFLIMCEDVEVYNNDIIIRDNSGVRIKGGNRIKVYSDDIDFQRYIDDTRTTACHSIQIENSGGTMKDIEIYDNILSNAPVSAFWIVGKMEDDNEDLHIHHNVIENAGHGEGWGHAGIIASGFDNIKIENNVFDGTQGDAVDFIGYNGVWESEAKATITNNVFVNSDGYGINNEIDEQTVVSESNCYYNNKNGNVNGCRVSDTDYFLDPYSEDITCDIEYKGGSWSISKHESVSYDDVQTGSTITVSGCDGQGDQEQINNALEQAESGDVVYLPAGVYSVDGPINFKCSGVTLKGDSDAIIRVEKTNNQWFRGLTGIINSFGYDDIIIEGFQLDGNCDELDSSLADSSSATSHDCQRGIVIQGSSQDFVKGITIRNMVIYDLFSDGVHVRFAESVIVENCEISNCQHEGCYFVCVRNGVMQNLKIAGITSDCARLDNSEKCNIEYNTFFSYTGDNSNGAYQGGQNGLQISDQGYSKGGGSDKSGIIHTNNIEVANNIFANCGQRSVWLDSAQKGLGENVYIHDNEFVGIEGIETNGVPVTYEGDKPVSYDNVPSIDTSENAFDSIFDVLMVKSYTQVGKNDAVILPDGVKKSPTKAYGIISHQTVGNETSTYVKIDEKYLKGVSQVKYLVEGKETVHTLMIGEKTSSGIKFTETSIWEGVHGHAGNSLQLKGDIDAQDITVTIITPTDSFEPVLEVVDMETEPLFIHPGIFFIIANVFVCILYVLFLLRNTV